MSQMTANEIRRSFLTSFQNQGHRIVASSPLVPHEDPTLLFTNAGMNQFKDTFLGRERRDYSRATSAQKCMRVSGKHNDLDNVGPSFRHHTFFEMLGNFSFGDYFKQDAIPFAWALLTREWKLPKDRLFATVFRGDANVPPDDEAYTLWRTFLPESQIGRLGAADNFWQMGETGPCGRCSEIYYVHGEAVPCAEEQAARTCLGPECGCDRFIEIWNNVFMEFNRQTDGTLLPLPAPSIDTGMGLERITAVLQGMRSNYDTDLFTRLLSAIGDRAGTRHGGTMSPSDVSMRVVADHMRAMTFLIADGVVPSNEFRGYVLRKIMRRAMRHGKRLGIAEPFLHALVDTLVHEFGEAYPELTQSRDSIAQVVRGEEDRFDAVLVDGLPRLEDVLDKAAGGSGVVAGDAAFRLYDTFGLPLNFIADMVEDRKLTLDRQGFEAAMEGQRQQARAKSKFRTAASEESAFGAFDGLPTRFTGYDELTTSTDVSAIARLTGADDLLTPVEARSLHAGDAGWVVLSETPFYVHSGGQVSDVGRLQNDQGLSAIVEGVEVLSSGVRVHVVRVEVGDLAVGTPVTASVDAPLRDASRRNHTATHLLHAALRQVLGGHVKQAGSLVAPDRLRFDFSHFTGVTPSQLLEVERIVNGQVLRNAPVHTDERSTEEAIAAGAMALFGEKYGASVRVVSVSDFSVELCGGTHVAATGDIGLFAVTSESGVAAGVRRVEAATGLASVALFQQQREALANLGAALNAKPFEMGVKAAALLDDNKRLSRDLQQARMKAAIGAGSVAGSREVLDAGGVNLVAQEVSGLDKDGLRALVDQHRSALKSGVVVLASHADGKVTIVVGVTTDLTKRVPAGQVVRQIAPVVGGGGGGRPDFAEAGGKDASKIGEMLTAAKRVVAELAGR
jgi:alanyl-tRNA synthetase